MAHDLAEMCLSCGAAFSVFGQSARSPRFPGLCNACAAVWGLKYEGFKRILSMELATWNRSPQDLAAMITKHCVGMKIVPVGALRFCADVSISFLNRTLVFLLRDGALSAQEETAFQQYCEALRITASDIPQLMQQVRHYALVRELQQGRLPTIQTGLMLPAGEVAHAQAFVAYHRELRTRTVIHPGSLIATSKRLIFSDTDLPYESPLSKVLEVVPDSYGGLRLQLAKRQGTGYYACQDTLHFVTVLRALLGQYNRHQAVQQAGSRSIPQDVKIAVYYRDGGRCVECGDSQYLEYDHIIPWSLGGASSVENLQILCRNCNLKKGAKL